jgi:hypothetical protein
VQSRGEGKTEHLAMMDNADDPATTTTWHRHVTDDEYLA